MISSGEDEEDEDEDDENLSPEGDAGGSSEKVHVAQNAVNEPAKVAVKTNDNEKDDKEEVKEAVKEKPDNAADLEMEAAGGAAEETKKAD